MINKDVKDYATHNWSRFINTITELSKNDKGDSLVDSLVQMYNFDNISKSLYNSDRIPTSADGLNVSGKAVELVEFKSGFKQRITKYNFDPSKGKCPDPNIDQVCTYYWELFFKNQKQNVKELISSIRFKAIESYITLEKQVFPNCQDAKTMIPLRLVVVIDGDGIDGIEYIYSELSGDAGTTQDNCFEAIRNALSRLKNLRDANGNAYYYDEIEVLSAQDYLNKLKLMD